MTDAPSETFRFSMPLHQYILSFYTKRDLRTGQNVMSQSDAKALAEHIGRELDRAREEGRQEALRP